MPIECLRLIFIHPAHMLPPFRMAAFCLPAPPLHWQLLHGKSASKSQKMAGMGGRNEGHKRMAGSGGSSWLPGLCVEAGVAANCCAQLGRHRPYSWHMHSTCGVFTMLCPVRMKCHSLRQQRGTQRSAATVPFVDAPPPPTPPPRHASALLRQDPAKRSPLKHDGWAVGQLGGGHQVVSQLRSRQGGPEAGPLGVSILCVQGRGAQASSSPPRPWRTAQPLACGALRSPLAKDCAAAGPPRSADGHPTCRLPPPHLFPELAGVAAECFPAGHKLGIAGAVQLAGQRAQPALQRALLPGALKVHAGIHALAKEGPSWHGTSAGPARDCLAADRCWGSSAAMRGKTRRHQAGKCSGHPTLRSSQSASVALEERSIMFQVRFCKS